MKNGRKQFLSQLTKSSLLIPAVASASPLLPDHMARAKSVIFLYMSGGMSHLDTFDPKPENKEVTGNTEAISTNVDGIQVSSFLPKIAKQMDKIAVINSMGTTQGAHQEGRYYAHTSYTKRGTISHPSIGTWVNRMCHKINPMLPTSVVVGEATLAASSGYMETKYAPMPIGDPNRGLQNSLMPSRIGKQQYEKRMSIAQKMNAKFLKTHNKKKVRAYEDMTNEALTLMNSKDLETFDLNKENDRIRDDYGRNQFGSGCLLARRLVENGVRFVEVGLGGWDNHNDIYARIGDNTKIIDDAVSALLSDLSARGLLDETLVVLTTEFGRTPNINKNRGRDHYPQAYSSILAGGGIRGGQVYGKTDEGGREIVENKVRPVDLNATIGHAMGIPLDYVITSDSGRPFRFAHKGHAVEELFV